MSDPRPVMLDELDDDARNKAHLASTLRIAVMRFARRLQAERNDDSLGLSQLSALATLWHMGPLSPTALAEIERVQPPSITRIIVALEGRGFIEREPHASDRRQSVIVLTEAGAELVIADRQRRQAWLANVLDELDQADLEILQSVVPVLERLSQG